MSTNLTSKDIAPKNPSPSDIKKMVELRKAGATLREIGVQTGRSQETVRTLLSKHSEYTGKPEGSEPPTIIRGTEPLPVGHRIVTDALWRGLERWRGGNPPLGD